MGTPMKTVKILAPIVALLLGLSVARGAYAEIAVPSPILPLDYQNATLWPLTQTDTCVIRDSTIQITQYARFFSNEKKFETVRVDSLQGTAFNYIYGKGTELQPDFYYEYRKTRNTWIRYDLTNGSDGIKSEWFPEALQDIGVTGEEYGRTCGVAEQNSDKFFNKIDQLFRK